MVSKQSKNKLSVKIIVPVQLKNKMGKKRGAKRDQSSPEAATKGLLFVTSHDRILHEGAEQFAGFTV